MLTILALEASTEACCCALFQDGKTVSSHFELAPRRHSAIILDRIDRLFLHSGISKAAVQAVAFGSGPGSFMGVRLATGVAQGLSYAWDVPVISISTLQIIAQSAYMECNVKKVIVGWDARMNGIYWGVYEANSVNDMVAVSGDQLSDPKDIPAELINKIPLVGNGWATYKDQLRASNHAQFKLIYPDMRHMGMILRQKFQNHEFVTSERAAPTYLRNNVAHKP